MQWTALLGKLLTLAPGIVQGVEVLKAESDSADKKQVAMDSLLLATGIANFADPADQALIAPLSAVASGVIDAIVTGNNQAGVFTHKSAVPIKPVPKPAPVAPGAMRPTAK